MFRGAKGRYVLGAWKRVPNDTVSRLLASCNAVVMPSCNTFLAVLEPFRSLLSKPSLKPSSKACFERLSCGLELKPLFVEGFFQRHPESLGLGSSSSCAQVAEEKPAASVTLRDLCKASFFACVWREPPFG